MIYNKNDSSHWLPVQYCPLNNTGAMNLVNISKGSLKTKLYQCSFMLKRLRKSGLQHQDKVSRDMLTNWFVILTMYKYH